MQQVHLGTALAGAMIAMVIAVVRIVKSPLADNVLIVDAMLATAATSTLTLAYCLPRSLRLMFRKRR